MSTALMDFPKKITNDKASLKEVGELKGVGKASIAVVGVAGCLVGLLCTHLFTHVLTYLLTCSLMWLVDEHTAVVWVTPALQW